MGDFFQDVWTMIIDSNILVLVKAIVILAAGWLFAIYISGLVSRMIRASSLEQKLNRCLPDGSAVPASKLEKYIGRAVYILILLFAILGCLTALNLSQAAAPIQKFFDMITAYAANLIGAAVLIFIAWLCATIAKYLLGTALKALSIDQKAACSLDMKEGGRPVSATASEIIYWVVLLFFLPAILRTLKIDGIPNHPADVYQTFGICAQSAWGRGNPVCRSAGRKNLFVRPLPAWWRAADLTPLVKKPVFRKFSAIKGFPA